MPNVISLSMKSLLVLVLATTNVNAFWRMECRARSGLARLDPLVSPGEVSGHAHAIHGGGAFGPSVTSDELVASDCTSCSVSQDKSAYWTPALYFQSASGEFTLVNQVGGMLAYYFLYPLAGETSVTPFPAGFSMIAGSNYQRNFTLPVPDPPKSNWYQNPNEVSQEGLAAKAVGFNCLNYATTPEGSLYRHFLPDKAYLDAHCTDGVRFELMFPSCWDGVNVDSADHKSHMAYPDLVMNGNCPAGFPNRTVGLFYETIWDTYAFNGQAGQFVISNGDPTGYGYHGDFIMGWEETELAAAVDQCTNPSGEISDCPVFSIQPASVYDTCTFSQPATMAAENLLSSMTALPGNVAIQSGPALAVGGSSAGHGGSPPPQTTAAVVPTLAYSAGESISTGGTYVPGAVFVASVSTPTIAPPAPVTTASPAVISAAPAIPDSQTLPAGESIYSTSYQTIGQDVMEIVMIVEEITVTTEATTTVYVPGGIGRREKRGHGSHMDLHRRNQV